MRLAKALSSSVYSRHDWAISSVLFRRYCSWFNKITCICILSYDIVLPKFIWFVCSGSCKRYFVYFCLVWDIRSFDFGLVCWCYASKTRENVGSALFFKYCWVSENRTCAVELRSWDSLIKILLIRTTREHFDPKMCRVTKNLGGGSSVNLYLNNRVCPTLTRQPCTLLCSSTEHPGSSWVLSTKDMMVT